MLNQGTIEINELNRDFYSKNNESFDKSRKDNFWKGFENVKKHLKDGQRILDLGCGNARFLEFLTKNNSNFNYLGVDNSTHFIAKNKQNYPTHKFIEMDIVSNLDQITNKYDLVTVFGVTHHIPGYEYRKDWFQKLEKILSSEGILVLSFWEFNTDKADKEFKPNHYQLEKNDYFLGWKGDFLCHRYCHLFGQEEIDEIKKILSNLIVIEEYSLDDNKYLVLKKER
jgi:cyclopropane fatty-acyl-phospholipid synthase-like methyltransferase